MYPNFVGSLVWLIAALALGAAELAVGDFTLLMLALAALGTSGVSLFGVPIAVEVVAFAIFAIGLLFLLRPWLRRRMQKDPILDTSQKALEGKAGHVLETVTGQSGQIRLAGSIWSAQSLDPQREFLPGEVVRVVSIEGNTAIVWENL
ncbi:hypothetical protein HMPREF1219_00597 [Corynebacterium pyruviciproducens ATCC BAA-1742]|uniref:NfeD-like C-terminal domain-containing protein n=1 Tax=Corynebacterium pyruviciproducens ATCC BAA-1742 TaxID=1125779 RepID=S2Z0J2_9CORY|nr:hypothetical protein HMPREF1219_00597 [Corynebacterium pyruviciproducens ATCC BAA-1742]